jgi:hypothetical protein
MRKTKSNEKPTPQQLARLLQADTSLTEAEKLEFARMLAGASPARKQQPSETPDWLASRFEAHAATQSQAATSKRQQRYVGLYVVIGFAVVFTSVVVLLVWGLA